MSESRARMRLPKLPRRQTRRQQAMHAVAFIVWIITGTIIGVSIASTVPIDFGGIWRPLIVIAAMSGAITVAAVLVRVGWRMVTDKYRRDRRG